MRGATIATYGNAHFLQRFAFLYLLTKCVFSYMRQEYEKAYEIGYALGDQISPMPWTAITAGPLGSGAYPKKARRAHQSAPSNHLQPRSRKRCDARHRLSCHNPSKAGASHGQAQPFASAAVRNFLMARPSTILPVRLNGRSAGWLPRAANGAIGFKYDKEWLPWEHALPISLLLPLNARRYTGSPLIAVFEPAAGQ